MITMIHRRHSSRSVSRLRGLALLSLILPIRPMQGQVQAQQESVVCTIQPRPVLAGLQDGDRFGRHTSLSQNGTIAAIGAPWYNNEGGSNGGYVQVFRFENNAWTQLGSTILGDTSTWTSQNALSDDGSVLAVGSWRNKIRVFRLVDDDWEPLGNNITNPNGEDFGWDLALSGDGTILAASSPEAHNFVSEVRVFEMVGGTWSQKGKTLQGQAEDDGFGNGLSLSQDGSRLAVGIPDIYNSVTTGFVQVYEFVDNDWVQIGQILEGSNVGDTFGYDVSLSSDGQTLAVGAPYYDINSNGLGPVNVYHFGSDGQWIEPGAMLIGKSEDNFFGDSVALSGDASILVASGVGLMKFFKVNGNEWIQVGEKATDSERWNYAAVSRDGSTAMGGASVFDISCPPGTSPVTTTSDPVPSPPTTTPPATETLPTRAPQMNPATGTMLHVTFSDVSLSFNNVNLMSERATEIFERLTKEWYETFFVERSGRVLQSVLLDARNMQTMIEVTEQKILASEDESSLVNKITYKQTIAYTAKSNTVDPKSYITLPFKDFDAITEYGEILKFELTSFQSLQSPLPIPQFETGGDDNDGEGSTFGILVGASIGGAVVLAISVFVWIRVKKRKEDAGGGQSPPSAAGVIVYDGQGEVLASSALAAQAVLLASDNPTRLEKGTSEVQTPSAGSLEPSPPQQVVDTPVPASTMSDGYIVQFKDQTRSASPVRLAQRDP